MHIRSVHDPYGFSLKDRLRENGKARSNGPALCLSNILLVDLTALAWMYVRMLTSTSNWGSAESSGIYPEHILLPNIRQVPFLKLEI